MNQKDKNIFIAIIFIIIFLLVWTLTNYNSTKREIPNEEILISEQNQENDSKNINEEMKNKNIIPIISITDLNKKILTDTTVVIIDTRSIEAFNAGHIKNSLHISEFDTTRQHRTIIFVTETGEENENLITNYETTSNTNKVYNLAGGFNAWKKSGNNIITLNIESTFENQAKVQFIEPRNLNKLLTDNQNSKISIIDTRRAGNYAKGHIQNAINIPFVQLEQRYKEISLTKKIYVYGTDEKTSFDAGVLLHDLGFIGTKTIRRGFTAWKEYKYPIVQ